MESAISNLRKSYYCIPVKVVTTITQSHKTSLQSQTIITIPGLRKLSNHMPHPLKRELENSRDTDQKSSVASNSNEMFVNDGESIDEKQNVRRSTRQRKFTYDNLNQTWLLASSIPEFSKFESLFAGDQRSPQDDAIDAVRPRRSERNHSSEMRRMGLAAEGLVSRLELFMYLG